MRPAIARRGRPSEYDDARIAVSRTRPCAASMSRLSRAVVAAPWHSRPSIAWMPVIRTCRGAAPAMLTLAVSPSGAPTAWPDCTSPCAGAASSSTAAIVARRVVKVSVIVPVYNPGANIEELIASLLGQSLARAEYEVIFVDDGSTDATPARLDALAAEHDNVVVEHIPNSGWPGRPRNVGLDRARGDYVFFADNDDWLEHDALERMHAMALADGADVVVGKVVGHGKYVPPGLFKRNLHNVSLRDAPLVALLSPHKLFRRAFLEQHGLRFPEGRRRLEDHVFVLRAYFATDRVSVLADHACYHWMRRGSANASSGEEWDPALYYAAVREVLDIVDEHTEPGEFRDRLYLRWYRAKTLGRVGGARSAITTRSPEWQRQAFDEVRTIVAERFGEHLDALLPPAERERARLVRAGDFDAVLAQARADKARTAHAELLATRRDGAATVLRCRLGLTGVEGEDGWAQVLVRHVGTKDQHVLPATV